MFDTAEFAAVVRADPVPLDLGAALIAAHGRPDTHPALVVRQLDELATQFVSDEPAALCAELFASGTFRGDAFEYYDPRNSLLDEVLERRVGIPISLAVVAIEVGRRLGVGLVGIGMPGHFLLRSAEDDREFFDPFHGGNALDAAGCKRFFDGLHGGQLRFTPELLDITPTRAILARILNNLVGAYQRIGDRHGLARALSLQCALPGAGTTQQHDLARVLASTGDVLQAATIHDQLALLDPRQSDEHVATAHRLRAQMN